MRAEKIQDDPERKMLRERGGAWLKKLREDAGLSQRQLAEAVDVGYYTFISQIESGRGRIPSDRYGEWARALKVDPQSFVCTLLSYYDPSIYAILFGDDNERRKDHLRNIRTQAMTEPADEPPLSRGSSPSATTPVRPSPWNAA